MSLSKHKGSQKRLKNKRTNSEAIDKGVIQSQLKGRGKPKRDAKVLISEVFSEAKKKRSKVLTNSNIKPAHSKKKMSKVEGGMFMTVGNNKISQRKKNLKLGKKDINLLFFSKKNDNLLLEEKVGNHVQFDKKKKSLKLVEEGDFESLVESVLVNPEIRFKSTKKKLGKADFELNMKRLSNAEKLHKKKLVTSPETRKRKNLQKELNVKMRRPSKENDLRIRKKVLMIQKMELELANGLNQKKKMFNSNKNVLNSVKLEKNLAFDENSNFFERKSTNYKIQKSISKKKKDFLTQKTLQAKSKEKQKRRRQSEKNLHFTKENTSLNRPKKRSSLARPNVLTSKNKRKLNEKEEGLLKDLWEHRESSRSKKLKRKRGGKSVKKEAIQTEARGQKKKVRESKQKETSRKNKGNFKRELLEKEIMKKLSKAKYHSLFKSQRKATLLKLVESTTEKTVNSGINRKNSKKLLGKINFDVLSKRKSTKSKNLRSLSKIFQKGMLKSKKDSNLFLLGTKSKSMKKKHEMNAK